METNEFNRNLTLITDEFIDKWIKLVDKFSGTNELKVQDRLLTLLYSHLGIEKRLSAHIWEVGSNFIETVIEIVKEEKADDTD